MTRVEAGERVFVWRGRQIIMTGPDEFGIYVGQCEEIPGCVAQGKDITNAVINTIDAIEAFIHFQQPEGE